jgi:hypothetical protein
MIIAAILVGVFFAAQGLLGIASPDTFLRLLRVVQTPPVLFLTAVIRLVFGVVLLYAAPASRFPMVLGILGGLIVIGSLLAPFYGDRFGHALLDWWSAGGSPRVRLWAALSLALGVFIVYAVARGRGSTF